MSSLKRGSSDEAPLDLHDVFETLYDGRWTLALCVAGALVLGALSVTFGAKIYRADALLQIEEKTKTLDPFRDAATGYTPETPSQAEIDLIRSRSALTEVVQKLHLDVTARPGHAKLLDRVTGWRDLAQVDRLELPASLERAQLSLVAHGSREYSLLDSSGGELLRGSVGVPASGSGVAILVTELVGQAGARFIVSKEPLARAIERFSRDLSVSERGRNTGVIALELRGPRPERLRAALDELIAVYLRRDVEHRTRAAERRLEFVNGQLPVLKANLEEAELRMKSYRARTGQLDIGLESKAIIDRGLGLETQITDLKLQLADLRQRYTDTHPTLVALNRKLDQLASAKHRLEAQAEAQPQTELNWVRLNRDVKVANELYVQLLAKAQELAVWKAANIGTIRLVDPAFVQPRPVKPDKVATLALSLLGGLACGLSWVLLRQGTSRGVRRADTLEQALGLPIYACLPKKPWRRKGAVLALARPDEPFVEALRHVRTRLAHELTDGRNNVVLLTASRPDPDLALVALNLAHLFAAGGKKSLLVDADLRKGPLRRHVDDARDEGLAEVLTDGKLLDELVRKDDATAVHVLFSGDPPNAPSELLGKTAFNAMITTAASRYDVVLIIAPPVLSVTDAAIVARVASTTLLLARAREHSLTELKLAAQRLEQCGARPTGFIITEVPDEDLSLRRARFHVQFHYR